jgi:hypothetical protein
MASFELADELELSGAFESEAEKLEAAPKPHRQRGDAVDHRAAQ